MDNNRVKGCYGPNDYGYINNSIREAAKNIQSAIYLYCEGHYPHSNAKDIESDHPLVVALENLCKIDIETCQYANKEHDVELFIPYKPPEENKYRWDMVIRKVGDDK